MKAHHMACLSVTFLMLYALISIGAEGRHVTIVVPGIAGRAPANVLIRVTVEPADDQRLLRIEAASDDFYRASEISLEGSAGPRTSWVRWNELPAGRYTVTATVASSVRVLARERRFFLVVGGPGDGS